VTLPLVVILALVLGNATNATNDSKKPTSSGTPAPSALPPVSAIAPPANPATAGACTKLLTALPVQLGELAPRIVHPEPDSPFVVAWGDPAVVLRCGVARPNGLSAGSSKFVLVVNGVNFFESKQGTTRLFTSIDRSAYTEVDVPSSYAQPALGAIADAIAKVLPPVCVVDPKETDPTKLCTNRK
jgi:hypothetical protein